MGVARDRGISHWCRPLEPSAELGVVRVSGVGGGGAEVGGEDTEHGPRGCLEVVVAWLARLKRVVQVLPHKGNIIDPILFLCVWTRRPHGSDGHFVSCCCAVHQLTS